jgi:hypothetical protein
MTSETIRDQDQAQQTPDATGSCEGTENVERIALPFFGSLTVRDIVACTTEPRGERLGMNLTPMTP